MGSRHPPSAAAAASHKALGNMMVQMDERRVQLQPRDGAMAATEVLCQRMTWMAERMGAATPNPPADLLSTT